MSYQIQMGRAVRWHKGAELKNLRRRPSHSPMPIGNYSRPSQPVTSTASPIA